MFHAERSNGLDGMVHIRVTPSTADYRRKQVVELLAVMVARRDEIGRAWNKYFDHGEIGFYRC